MTTIRIADVPHPKEEHPRTNLQDGVSSSGGDGIYGRQSFSRSGTADPVDDIYNIRSRSKPPSTNRRGSRMTIPDRGEDDDPGLRTPGDFKQKQVPTEPMDNLCDLRSFWPGIQGEVASVACLSINRSHLRRHRDQSSLRLLIDVQLGTLTPGPHRSALDNHLESVYDGDGEVRDRHSPCG
jgi:hypothetical protein